MESGLRMKLFTDSGRYAGLYEIDFNIQRSDSVLDVGGGNRPFPESTHVIDMASTNAQRHFRPLNIGDREFIEGPAHEALAEYPDNHFDFCYSSHTFEHVHELEETLNQISRTCKRGFYALPGSDLEFITAKKHFGHVNLCRQIGDVLHFCNRPPNTIIEQMAIMWEKLFQHPLFNKLFEGHGCRGFRFIWEIRHYWEDEIKYKFYENGEELFPQLQYFDEI